MDDTQANRSRWEQTSLILDRTSAALNDWIDHRNQDDDRSFHRSQLDDIQTLLSTTAATLRDRLDRIDLACSPDTVFAECREFDKAVAAIHRIWDLLRSKFDQRDGDAQRNTMLKAADEVAWSCYRQVLVRASARNSPLKASSPPLTCIDATWAPAVSSREQLPEAAQIQAAQDLKFLTELGLGPRQPARHPGLCQERRQRPDAGDRRRKRAQGLGALALGDDLQAD